MRCAAGFLLGTLLALAHGAAAQTGDDPLLHKARLAREDGWDTRESRELWDPDTTGYDALHVQLIVEPDIAAEGLNGRVIWTLRITESDVSALAFNFFDNLDVHAAMVNGARVHVTREQDVLKLPLSDRIAVGDTVRAEIVYGGLPEHGFIWGFEFNEHDGVPIVYTQVQPEASRTWWPCKDRPDDKFTAELSFIVPDTLLAASNGRLVETRPLSGGRMLYRWREQYAIATYLVSLVATNYATFEGIYEGIDGTEMPVTYFAYPEHLDQAIERWTFTPEVMTFFAHVFGEYPFLEEKYGMAEYPWAGAMEHQTLSSMGSYFFNHPERSDWVVVHELAHQWWGNWVTCGTWRDIWLNEGFAVYCEALYGEHLAGPDSLQAYMLYSKRDHFPGSVYDPDFIFNSTVYRKGAWVLHMLRHVVGDAVFFDALRLYGERFAYGNAITEDLREVFEEVWGQSLGWFFEQWVYGEGRPLYGVFWDPEDPSSGGDLTAVVKLVQEWTGPHGFKMPLDFRFRLRDGSDFQTVVWDSLPWQRFEITLPAPAESLMVDPDNWVLAEIFYGRVPSGAGEDEAHVAPGGARITLGRPRPNPTAGSVRLPITWHAGGARRVRLQLTIHDPGGRLVRLLETEADASGSSEFRWDGRDLEGRLAPPGVYFAKLRLPGGHDERAARKATRRVILLR